MKEKYTAPAITTEELEKTDVLLSSTIEENRTFGFSTFFSHKGWLIEEEL